MQILEAYIARFLGSNDPNQQALGAALEQTRQTFDVLTGRDPITAFQNFVDMYNWLGDPVNKSTYGIVDNVARNLTGALMQDYLIHLMTQLLRPYPQLDTFTEVRVPFGTYPLWEGGNINYETPSQVVDLAVGYSLANGQRTVPQAPWPRPVISRLQPGTLVMPLVVINSKIRIDQGAFFDWIGRDQLLAKGNPTCLSLQVALRSEMDLKIVEATQASERFFLLGRGGERNVVGDRVEIDRLVKVVAEHLAKHMI
jgi:hypothetical protein